MLINVLLPWNHCRTGWLSCSKSECGLFKWLTIWLLGGLIVNSSWYSAGTPLGFWFILDTFSWSCYLKFSWLCEIFVYLHLCLYLQVFCWYNAWVISFHWSYFAQSYLWVFRSRSSKDSWVSDFFLTGSLSASQVSKKHISSKVVVIILLLCIIILTTFAFLASAMCYIFRKDKFPVQASIFTSEKDTSCNSGTNLISLRTSSVLATKVTIDSTLNPSTGKSFYLSFKVIDKNLISIFSCK